MYLQKIRYVIYLMNEVNIASVVETNINKIRQVVGILIEERKFSNKFIKS